MNRILLLIFFTLIIDLIWIGKITKSHWDSNIQNIQGIPLKIKPGFAALSYICLIGGLIYFVQSDLHINKNNYMQKSLINGALFGLAVYGVYDFTNLAIFNNWSLNVAIMDILWGTFLCSVIPFISNYIYYEKFT